MKHHYLYETLEMPLQNLYNNLVPFLVNWSSHLLKLFPTYPSSPQHWLPWITVLCECVLFLQTHLLAVMRFHGGISIYIIAYKQDIFVKISTIIPKNMWGKRKKVIITRILVHCMINGASTYMLYISIFTIIEILSSQEKLFPFSVRSNTDE